MFKNVLPSECASRLLTVGFHEVLQPSLSSVTLLMMSRCHTLLPAYSPAHASTRLNSTVSTSLQHIRNILTHERSADEGGVTRMSGGIQAITLPAGYLGSSFIGACLIACGFDTNASKIACLVLAAFFLFTLWWARKNWLYVWKRQ